MAEFIDVIHTIQRICKRRNGECNTCLLGEFACPNNERFDKTDEAAFRELEDVVVRWAEEHPEPKYPTWMEYLFTIYDTVWPKIATMEIPADIAQKLGIEPKEE